jgi:pyruvate kinase
MRVADAALATPHVHVDTLSPCRVRTRNMVDVITHPATRAREADLDALIAALSALAATLLEVEDEHASALARVAPEHLASARNLLHYLALRRIDICSLQERLQALGLSSLGRAEAHVLGNVHAVLRILHRLDGRELPASLGDAPAPAFGRGPALLRDRTDALLGEAPANRAGRIMVTMPSEAAREPGLVRDFLRSGMDCMRINCAHDDAAAWERMIVHLRAAQRELQRDCRVLMDLGGPKLRTGPIASEPAVLQWKPERDARGRVRRPARVWLTPWPGEAAPPDAAAAVVQVPEAWLAVLRDGEAVGLRDARGKRRTLRIAERHGHGRWAESTHTTYVTPRTVLRRRAGGRERVTPQGLAPRPGSIDLRRGDTLILSARRLEGHAPPRDAAGRRSAPAVVSCTLPEALAHVAAGERVWLDDGKIGGRVRRVDGSDVEIEVVHAAPTGSKLLADRGINFPDSDLRLPALTNKDLVDLPFVAAHADLVGLSWVQCAEDVLELQARLRALGADHVGVFLKIETRQAFEQLPELLLAAMRDSAVGVMIARGDLAVECGWEHLAEVQEQILWVCEAAHVPVVWATQVLESLAKSGQPSRAEITDAAMGVRAECVMLNKGPHVAEAIRVLDRILQRMGAHQSKKTARLARLGSWSGYDARRGGRADQGPRGGGAGAVSGTTSMASSSE